MGNTNKIPPDKRLVVVTFEIEVPKHLTLDQVDNMIKSNKMIPFQGRYENLLLKNLNSCEQN